MTSQEVLADYPALELDDVLAALEFAAKITRTRSVSPISAAWMRLLVDARLASVLADLGHDVVHTSQLPIGNRTPHSEIVRAADSDARVVVTKDRDFLDLCMSCGCQPTVTKKPWRIS